jgi:hypothetical protein
MPHQSASQDQAADAADRLGQRNAVIASILGFGGVLISGILLIIGETSL